VVANLIDKVVIETRLSVSNSKKRRNKELVPAHFGFVEGISRGNSRKSLSFFFEADVLANNRIVLFDFHTTGCIFLVLRRIVAIIALGRTQFHNDVVTFFSHDFTSRNARYSNGLYIISGIHLLFSPHKQTKQISVFIILLQRTHLNKGMGLQIESYAVDKAPFRHR
jgi:hypothetical protein